MTNPLCTESTMKRTQSTPVHENIGSGPNVSRFQWIMNPEQEVAIPSYDLPLFTSDLFVMMPTLGCLVPGWFLVVPRRPMANLTNLDACERKRLQELIAALRPRLNYPGRETFYFEHGSVPGSPASCGVNQAHLHIVLLPFDLVGAAIERRDISWKPTSCSAYSLDVQQNEYLFVSDSHGRSMIGSNKSTSSQWFRRLIASETNQHDLWDYRTHTGSENMIETARLVGTIP